MEMEKGRKNSSDDIKYLVGHRIREARDRKGLTQEYMAEKLNVTATHYCNIENGRRSCTLQKFVQVCWILDAKPGELLRDCITVDNTQGENINVTELVRQLGGDDKKRLEAMIVSYCKALD